MTSTEPGVRPALDAEAAFAQARAVIDANARTFGVRYPGDTTVDQVYRLRPASAVAPEGGNDGWTTSFWPGQLWLAYELTGDEDYRDLGLAHVASFADRVEREVGLATHDLGFLYTLACVAPSRLLGDEHAERAALAAADHLMARFLEPAGIIQAWGDLTHPSERGRTIIDSLMNMPLLRWAGERTGEARYADAADRHVAQLRQHIVRADDTTFHTFHWDPVTGEPLRGTTQQGYADDSCWARGQAWGVYGFAIDARETGNADSLATAVRVAEYFLDHLPADGVAYWDLVFTDGSDQPRDSSAAAIAASGLLELAPLVAGTDPEAAERYSRQAHAMLASLAADYTGADVPGSNALILHGVYDWPKSIGVDEGTLWGDYFYLEALVRVLRPRWQPYW